MTLTAATVLTVSGGRIAIADDDLAYYDAIAVAVLARDGGAALPAVVASRAEALLVCHFHAADTQGDLETKSETRGGDWSFSKQAGDTTYLVQYRALLAQFGIVVGAVGAADVPDEGSVRCDAEMPGLQLTGNALPAYSDDEGGALL